VILALFIRTWPSGFKIPTGSMETNLLIGDLPLVNKLVYSPSAGAWESELLGKKPIGRGHVIVFKYPEDPSRDFIKRVIGCPARRRGARQERDRGRQHAARAVRSLPGATAAARRPRIHVSLRGVARQLGPEAGPRGPAVRDGR
jgi:hypothetical protein